MEDLTPSRLLPMNPRVSMPGRSSIVPSRKVLRFVSARARACDAGRATTPGHRWSGPHRLVFFTFGRLLRATLPRGPWSVDEGPKGRHRRSGLSLGPHLRRWGVPSNTPPFARSEEAEAVQCCRESDGRMYGTNVPGRRDRSRDERSAKRSLEASFLQLAGGCPGEMPRISGAPKSLAPRYGAAQAEWILHAVGVRQILGIVGTLNPRRGLNTGPAEAMRRLFSGFPQALPRPRDRFAPTTGRPRRPRTG